MKDKQNHKAKALASFAKNKLAVIALIVLLLLIGLAILAPLVAPYDPLTIDVSHSLQGCSSEHWMGTDVQGRDVLSRIIYGTRTALAGAIFIVIISTIIGTLIGFFAGFYGGIFDNIMMRILDIILSFPSLLLAFVAVAVFGRGLVNTVIVLSIVYIPLMARVVRSVTMVEKNNTYVEAARTLKYSNMRIVFVHILPNCLPIIIVQATTNMAYSLLDLAAMSFLGLGVGPPTPDWGSMLAEGREYLMLSPNASIASGLAIMITVICFNLLGDGLQAYFDPQQHKS